MAEFNLAPWGFQYRRFSRIFCFFFRIKNLVNTFHSSKSCLKIVHHKGKLRHRLGNLADILQICLHYTQGHFPLNHHHCADQGADNKGRLIDDSDHGVNHIVHKLCFQVRLVLFLICSTDFFFRSLLCIKCFYEHCAAV